MTVGRVHLLVRVGVFAVVAATAVTGAGGASAARNAPAAPVAITHGNGLVAASCLGYSGLSTNRGWLLYNDDGQTATSNQIDLNPWPYGTYDGGVDWAPDGTEMVHDASASKAGFGHASVHTVFLSEASATGGFVNPRLAIPFDYPWQDTNYDNDPFTAADTDTTFSGDGKHILFTRTLGGVSTVETIPAAGWDPPIDLDQPAGNNSQPSGSVTGDIAFVNVASSGPTAGQPWIWILSAGQVSPVALVQGYKPKFSPDGTMIAFIDSAGTLSTMTTTGTSIAPAGPTMPSGSIRDFAWSPDQTQFVFGLSAGSGGIASAPIGAGSTLFHLPTQTTCSALGNQVSWQPVPNDPASYDHITRVWGATRQDTSVATSHATFPTPGSADAVVLADSYHFPDALSGAPLARFVNGPLLLTPGAQSTVWPSVATEIARVLGSTSKPVYILGGTGSVSQADQDQLGALGYSVHRIGGANRYETSLNIAKFMGQGASAPGELLLATGTDFPDGLSAGAAAASYWTPVQTGGAVLLTNGAAMYPAIKTYVDAALAAQTLGRRVYVTTVGGLADKAYAGTASNPKISAVGADRYTTSAYVAEIHFGAQASVAIATGTSFPDALSGGAYAGAINAPLLLVPSSLVNEAHEFDEVPYFLNIASGAIVDAYIFGGTGVVNTAQRDQLASIIGMQVQLGEITPTSVLSARARGLGPAGTARKPAPGAAAGSRAGAGGR